MSEIAGPKTTSTGRLPPLHENSSSFFLWFTRWISYEIIVLIFFNSSTRLGKAFSTFLNHSQGPISTRCLQSVSQSLPHGHFRLPFEWMPSQKLAFRFDGFVPTQGIARTQHGQECRGNQTWKNLSFTGTAGTETGILFVQRRKRKRQRTFPTVHYCIYHICLSIFLIFNFLYIVLHSTPYSPSYVIHVYVIFPYF